MFISKEEKTLMLRKIEKLEQSLSTVYTSLRLIEQKLDKKPKPKKTEAQKAKQREYMRAYKARKLAEKKAQQAVA